MDEDREKAHTLTITIEKRPMTPLVSIFVNGHQLGVVQNVKFEADAKEHFPKAEITVLSESIEGLSDSLKSSIVKTRELLSLMLPFVTIIEKDLEGRVLSIKGPFGSLVCDPESEGSGIIPIKHVVDRVRENTAKGTSFTANSSVLEKDSSPEKE